MDLLPVDTILYDLNDEPHRYESVPLAFDECFDLGLELAALIGGPLGDAFKGLLMGSDLDDANLDKQVLKQAVASIGELPAKLLQAGGSKLVARVLHTTIRICELPGPPPELVKQRLREPGARSEAYAGGNLREAVDAVRWVLEVNYGPFLVGMWNALRPRLAGLAGSFGIDPLIPESAPKKSPKRRRTSRRAKPIEAVS